MKRRVLICGAALLALAGTAAQARCPEGREDAARGIVITLEPGLFLTDRVGQDGMIESVQWADFSTERMEFEALHGVLPVSFTMRRSLEPDAFVNGYAIAWEGAAMPEPVRGMEWRGVGARVFHNDEEETEPGVITYLVQVTGEGEVAIGTCRYAALTVETRMEESDATFTTEEVMDYLPALGIALMRRNRTVPLGEVPGDWHDWPGAQAIAVVEE